MSSVMIRSSILAVLVLAGCSSSDGENSERQRPHVVDNANDGPERPTLEPGLGTSWVIHFDFDLGGHLGQNQVVTRGRGVFHLSANFTGRGAVSIKRTVVSPDVVVQASGSGEFGVFGKARGDRLIFAFDNTAVELAGTLRSILGESVYEDWFSVQNLAPGAQEHQFTTIGRQVPATTTRDVNGGGLTGKTSFRVVAAPPPRPPAPDASLTADDTANPKFDWVLEFECESTSQAYGVSDQQVRQRMSGSIAFEAGLFDAQAREDGEFTYEATYRATSPVPQNGAIDGGGTLILDGSIEEETLVFTPAATLDSSRHGLLRSQESAGTGAWFFDVEEPVRLRLVDGASHRIPFAMDENSTRTNGWCEWRLRGPERWRVTVQQENTVGRHEPRNGESGILWGLRVRWEQVFEFVISNGEYRSGRGWSQRPEVEPLVEVDGKSSIGLAHEPAVGTGSDVEYEHWELSEHASRYNDLRHPEFDSERALDRALLEARETPYSFPEKFAVSGNVNGQFVTLDLPQPSGFVVSYRRTEIAPSDGRLISPPGDVEYERFLSMRRALRVPLEDGYENSENYDTSFLQSGSGSWSESPSRSNPNNRREILVEKLRAP